MGGEGRGREGKGRGLSLPKVNFLVMSLHMRLSQLGNCTSTVDWYTNFAIQ